MVSTRNQPPIIGRPVKGLAGVSRTARPPAVGSRPVGRVTSRSRRASMFTDGTPPVPMRVIGIIWYAVRTGRRFAGVTPRQASGTRRTGTAGLILLTLVTLGCSNSPEDDEPAAMEAPPSTTTTVSTTTTTAPTTTARPDPPTTIDKPEPAPTTTLQPDRPTTTTQPDEPEPAPTTTLQPEKPEPSTGTEGSLETVSTATFPGLGGGGLFPWGDGFLHTARLLKKKSDEESCEPAPLKTRYSQDGLEWTEFTELEIPSVHAIPSQFLEQHRSLIHCWTFHYRFPLRFHSDGKRLAVVSQWPVGLETWAGTTQASAALLDVATQIQPTIYLSVTEDLATWDTIAIPIEQPRTSHESLHAEVTVTSLSFNDDGWLMVLHTLTYMNFFSVLPDEIKESAITAKPDFAGPWYDEVSGEEGIAVLWSTEDDTNNLFVSWEELGITLELLDVYGPNQQPYPSGQQYSGSILVGSWGGEPTHYNLPNSLNEPHRVSRRLFGLSLSPVG